ncbi:hypothetical protein B296_00037179 [Ensete ventricosum]|uniref:Uncharacterized protein n=1 Tax=Ensete ventricosum TaxID=4639 RepID=A0A426XFS4_ENSVE|nr:hypothetical protein B296_00037179 [Ensete ventricosum]
MHLTKELSEDYAGKGIEARDLDNDASILAKFDQELLGALLWRTTQRQRLWIQGVNAMVLKQAIERDEEVMMSPKGLSYPKSKASVRKEVDLEECHSAAEADLPIVKKGTQRQDFRRVIDPLLSWRESVGRKRGRGARECRGNLQVPRQGERVKAKELHKTGVNGLLIKIAESEGLWVDAGVLD